MQRDAHWTLGNDLRLLENGDEYFSRVFEVIADAKSEVLIETFIWFEDRVGHELRDALVKAAERGVAVDVTVDGYGTPSLSAEFIEPLVSRGVRIYSFDPNPSWLAFRVNPFCRLHRKIVVVDGETAFVGGINFADDQRCAGGGPESKQDYAVEAKGPIVDEIHRFCHSARDDRALPKRRRYWLRRFPRKLMNPGPGMQALLATRDNAEHPTDIEKLYRLAFRRARKDITIANAYFFPGFRFLRDLGNAAKRGVRVRLIIQGRPDKGYSSAATETLYDSLLANGIEVLHYNERALHAKVAVVDDDWATVGSSNLDPTSFALNLEANLVVQDPRFVSELRSSLDRLIERSCEPLTPERLPAATLWKRFLRLLLYHLARRFPAWGKRFPLGAQRIRAVSCQTSERAR